MPGGITVTGDEKASSQGLLYNEKAIQGLHHKALVPYEA